MVSVRLERRGITISTVLTRFALDQFETTSTTRRSTSPSLIRSTSNEAASFPNTRSVNPDSGQRRVCRSACTARETPSRTALQANATGIEARGRHEKRACPRSSNGQAAKECKLCAIQNDGQHDSGAQNACYELQRQRRHKQSARRKHRNDCHVRDRGRDQPSSGHGTPHTLPFPCDVEHGLSTEHQRDDGNGPQGVGIETQYELAGREGSYAEEQIDHAHGNARQRQVAYVPDVRAR